jgi:YbbR domain-containing protein
MKFFTHNLGWKLVSLVAAFFVWMNIAGEPELASIIPAPVEYKNYPKDLEISSEIVESIDVEARGPAGQLRELSDERLSAVLDFSGVKAPGERTFTLTASELKLPSGIELVRTIPAQLRYTFEHRETRAIKVNVPLSGPVDPDVMVTLDIQPPTLNIAGPESRVNAVTNAISDPLDVSHLNGDSRQILAVYISEPEVRFLSKPQVTVKVHVERTR